MIIDFSNEFIFLKSMKTAGTSVEIFLRQFLSPNSVASKLNRHEESSSRELGLRTPATMSIPWRGMDYESLGKLVRRKGQEWPSFRQHQPANSLMRSFPKEFFSFRKVSISRDPFDRVVSLYFWRNAKKIQREGPGSPQVIKDFETFVLKDLPREKRILLLPTHVRGRSVVDHWMRFENLEEDVGEVVKRFFSDDVERKNYSLGKIQTKNSIRKPEYTVPKMFQNPRLVERVLNLFSDDFTFHQYPTTPQTGDTGAGARFGDMSG
jgi:hypothetical protein